jgi:hypothetical protein
MNNVKGDVIKGAALEGKIATMDIVVKWMTHR